MNLHRGSWPYVVLALLTLAFEAGWEAKDIQDLAVVLLVLIAVIYAARGGGSGSGSKS